MKECEMDNPNSAVGRDIELHKAELADLIVAEQWARNPGFHDRYGPAGRAKCVEDVSYNLSYLAAAMAADSPVLFTTYIEWVKVLFAGLNIPVHELAESLKLTRDVLSRRFPAGGEAVSEYITGGLEQLEVESKLIPSFFDGVQPLSGLGRQYFDLLRRGDRAGAARLILDAAAQGISVKDLYIHVFQPSQLELGRLWQTNQMSVAEEHFCTAATQLVMAQLYPLMFDAKRNGRRLVAACVGGELHEISLRMVSDFFEMEGWDTYYLGSSTPASSVVRAVIERKADLLLISATMSFNVKLVANLIDQMRAADPDRRVKILVGGYPFNLDPELWRRVGADGTAPDASQAIALAARLMAGIADP